MLKETCSGPSAGDRLFCARVPELTSHFAPPHLTGEAVQDLRADLSPDVAG